MYVPQTHRLLVLERHLYIVLDTRDIHVRNHRQLLVVMGVMILENDRYTAKIWTP